MLVNCPRCGFSQPNDQYCAQCGVDMNSFKRKTPPLFKRIFSNAIVQIVILIIAAVFSGQYIFRHQAPQSWVQKITHFQGLSKSKKSISVSTVNRIDDAQPETEVARSASLHSPKEAVALSAASGATLTEAPTPPTAVSFKVSFKVTYAEISADVLAKLIEGSTGLGLYQILNTYSAGIINDFSKRSDDFKQTLKIADIKLSLGTTNSHLSGLMSPDGSQILGLVTSIEYKSNDNELISGEITVANSSSQNNELYPAEFNLPKGAAFFIIGALKQDSFSADRSKLTMPPFQIFKSNDFMTRKTEFVIIIEPNYN